MPCTYKLHFSPDWNKFTRGRISSVVSYHTIVAVLVLLSMLHVFNYTGGPLSLFANGRRDRKKRAAFAGPLPQQFVIPWLLSHQMIFWAGISFSYWKFVQLVFSRPISGLAISYRFWYTYIFVWCFTPFSIIFHYITAASMDAKHTSKIHNVPQIIGRYFHLYSGRMSARSGFELTATRLLGYSWELAVCWRANPSATEARVVSRRN